MNTQASHFASFTVSRERSDAITEAQLDKLRDIYIKDPDHAEALIYQGMRRAGKEVDVGIVKNLIAQLVGW